jgi:predicted ATPase
MTRFRTPGLYVLDEPEAALSLQGQLRLMRVIHDSCELGSQFVIATHSPILMAMPGASIVEFTSDGLASVAYDDVAVVQLWRQYLDEPQSFLRHLLSDDN